jgi:hypothetical protein
MFSGGYDCFHFNIIRKYGKVYTGIYPKIPYGYDVNVDNLRYYPNRGEGLTGGITS